MVYQLEDLKYMRNVTENKMSVTCPKCGTFSTIEKDGLKKYDAENKRLQLQKV
jgi:hypothetical protein